MFVKRLVIVTNQWNTERGQRLGGSILDEEGSGFSSKINKLDAF